MAVFPLDDRHPPRPPRPHGVTEEGRERSLHQRRDTGGVVVKGGRGPEREREREREMSDREKGLKKKGWCERGVGGARG